MIWNGNPLIISKRSTEIIFKKIKYQLRKQTKCFEKQNFSKLLNRSNRFVDKREKNVKYHILIQQNNVYSKQL